MHVEVDTAEREGNPLVSINKRVILAHVIKIGSGFCDNCRIAFVTKVFAVRLFKGGLRNPQVPESRGSTETLNQDSVNLQDVIQWYFRQAA